jgi:hypothetical protein
VTSLAPAVGVDALDHLVHQLLVEDVDEVTVVRDRFVHLLREAVEA